MNELENGQTPALAMPCRPEGRLTLPQFLRLVRDNTLATYSPEAFEEDIIAHRLLWRRRFIINEPGAIRHASLGFITRTGHGSVSTNSQLTLQFDYSMKACQCRREDRYWDSLS